MACNEVYFYVQFGYTRCKIVTKKCEMVNKKGYDYLYVSFIVTIFAPANDYNPCSDCS